MKAPCAGGFCSGREWGKKWMRNQGQSCLPIGNGFLIVPALKVSLRHRTAHRQPGPDSYIGLDCGVLLLLVPPAMHLCPSSPTPFTSLYCCAHPIGRSCSDRGPAPKIGPSPCYQPWLSTLQTADPTTQCMHTPGSSHSYCLSWSPASKGVTEASHSPCSHCGSSALLSRDHDVVDAVDAVAWAVKLSHLLGPRANTTPILRALHH